MQLHRATKEELHDVAAFINDRFWELEQHTLLARGLSDPKGILCRSTEASLMLFHKKGDVHVCGDEDMAGVLVGVEARRFNLLNTLLCTLSAGKLLSGLSRQDVAAIRNNGALQGKVHQRTWYRRYTRNAYYINWIAVAKELKGKGVFRQLLTPVLAQCDAVGMDVVLETFTASNVPIYEHFGFELVETHRSDDVELVEYCLIRRCAGERRS